MIGAGNNGDDWKRELLTIIMMIAVACIVAGVFWWEIHHRLVATRAFGAELISQDTTPIVSIESVDQKLRELELELLNSSDASHSSEDIANETSADNNTPQDKNSKDSIDVMSVTQKKINVLNTYIAYSNPKISEEERNIIATGLVTYADEYNLPIGLVAGICRAESNFSLSAHGIKTKYGRAVGAMQVMWPVHEKLAKSLGVNSQQEMFSEKGIKVGCHILRTYINNEHSVIGGLKCYLSQLSKVYILEKVMITYLIIDQLLHDGITENDLHEVSTTETTYMKKLVH